MQPEIPDLVKPSAYLLLYHASFVQHKRLLTKAHCCHRPPWRVIDSEEVEMFLEFKFCRLLRCSAPGCLLQTSPPDMEKWRNTLSCNFLYYDILHLVNFDKYYQHKYHRKSILLSNYSASDCLLQTSSAEFDLKSDVICYFEKYFVIRYFFFFYKIWQILSKSCKIVIALLFHSWLLASNQLGRVCYRKVL